MPLYFDSPKCMTGKRKYMKYLGKMDLVILGQHHLKVKNVGKVQRDVVWPSMSRALFSMVPSAVILLAPELYIM